jgi:hypothetical protein
MKIRKLVIKRSLPSYEHQFAASSTPKPPRAIRTAIPVSGTSKYDREQELSIWENEGGAVANRLQPS